MHDDNPIPGKSPETYEEATFNDDAAYAIVDGYLALLDLGFDPEDCHGIRTLINQCTIFDAERIENNYELIVSA